MGNFVAVAKLADLPPGEMKQIKLEKLRLVVANIEGDVLAFGWECLHTRGAPLADGWLEGEEVECPWHGGRYNIRSGEATSFPACDSIPIYEVKLEGEDILVDIPE